MKIGLISDLHLGYSRGTRTIDGVNVREQDFITAARNAVFNLLNAGVDVIVDLGDMAETPAPRKRAVLALIEIIRDSNVEWYSANGNHTLQRTRSDIHLYDVLGAMCPNFHGYVEPTYVDDIGGLFVPYGSVECILEGLSLIEDNPAQFVVGHWSASDVPYPGEHVPVDALPVHPVTFLGHYHKRTVPWGIGPIYIGATERSAWGEWNNPTGVAIFDTEAMMLEFIDHPVRPWLDLHADSESYLEEIDRDIEGAIVRLTVDATREQYTNLDLVGLRKKARALNPLEFEVRRRSQREASQDPQAEATFDLAADWKDQVAGARLARGIDRPQVYQIGVDALAAAQGAVA